MSYVALYRKFRPDSFEEVKGQEHIVTTLRNQLIHDRVGHAYLFCGTRGTGKTTMAKILAKSVNCDNPGENGPCGVCDSCKAIADGSSLNVIEIDAASNSGVDNIRQIKEAVQYSPAQGKYLVYIIDEVHMLSAGAYNALLKTLEEPPEYVIFILATTDEHKIPVTIKSRCQRYDFHRISIDTIADRLEEIVSREGEKASREALRFIARSADGSMRDALSILDECMSVSYGTELTRDSVLKTIGAVSVDIYVELLQYIKEDNPEKVLELINETIYNGKDLTKFADDFTYFLRNVLFLKLSPNVAEDLDLTQEAAEQLKQLGEMFSSDALTRYLSIMQEECSAIRISSVKRVSLEMAMIKMMRPETDVDYSSLIARLEKLEISEGNSEGVKPNNAENTDADIRLNEEQQREIDSLIEGLIEKKLKKYLAENTVQRNSQNETKSPFDAEKQSDIIVHNIREKYAPATAEELLKISREWRDKIVPRLSGPLKRFAMDVPVEPAGDYSEEGVSKLLLVFDERDITSDTRYGYFSEEKHRNDLANDLSEILGKRVEFEIVTRKGIRGTLDEDSTALNKILYDNVKEVESEDELDG